MFWGLKLEEGNNYSQVVDNPFHVSNATLSSTVDTSLSSQLVAVHVVVNKAEDYILCYLGAIPGADIALQHSLNLDFSEGEHVTLYIDHISGSSCTVHLTGCYNESDGLDMCGLMDSDIESGEEEALLFDGNGHALNGNALPPAIEELPKADAMKRKRSNSASGPQGNGLDAPVAKKKKKGKKKKVSEGAVNGKPNSQQKPDTAAKESKSFKTTGGTEVEEIKQGTGKVAKAGRKVFLKYTGRLAHNNRIFDSNIDVQKAFVFRLGQGEVIKGWDEGLQGMKIGEKRRLTIPPNQGYGAKGAPPKIPPNSKLIFDVELLNVK